MKTLPLFHQLAGRRCLVVGGGQVAWRKISLLLDAGAKVHAVALAATPAVVDAAETDQLELSLRAFDDRDVDGVAVVIAATNDRATNATISHAAMIANVPVNCVDQPQDSSVLFPAIVDRDDVVVAVSTGGGSPTLARLVRARLESVLPRGLGRLAAFARTHRQRVKAALGSTEARQRFWDGVLTGPIADQIIDGKTRAAEAAFDGALAGVQPTTGWVALVGAGPGDPELITLKGLQLLQRAEVILYDNLVGAEVLDYARRDAEKIYVGKRRSAPPSRQGWINDQLLEHAQAGRGVVRLKGGDPFIFGRGGEEIERLAEAGIDCTVVPGITAALGASSYAGIPLTHRDLAQSVRFVTGHRVDDVINLDWPELAKPGQTIVIYMGLVGIEEIFSHLIAHGLAATTPAALVERATLPEQRTIVGTVDSLPALVAAEGVRGPTTIIVGQVVALASDESGGAA